MIGWENNQGAYFINKLDDKIDDTKTDVSENTSNIGKMSDLSTTAKDTLVKAVNEVVGEIGKMSDLSTTAKDTLVKAVNEVVTDLGKMGTVEQILNEKIASTTPTEYSVALSSYKFILFCTCFYSNVNATVLIPVSLLENTSASSTFNVLDTTRNIAYAFYKSGTDKLTIAQGAGATANADGVKIYGIWKVV